MKRTIMIFPEFENISVIDSIREKYDPLAHHVKPHITLVFTFESDLNIDEMRTHLINSLSDIAKFELSMYKIVKIDNQLGKFLFLLLDKGVDQVKKISSKLYTGILEDHKPVWLNEETYLPHMTLGSFSSKDELESAYNESMKYDAVFKTVVKKISVEIIDENEDSIVDIEVALI